MKAADFARDFDLIGDYILFNAATGKESKTMSARRGALAAPAGSALMLLSISLLRWPV
jgi:hypothetical protein